MTNGITRVEALQAAINGDLTPEVIDKLQAMIQTLSKPGKKTETKDDRERAALVAQAVETLKGNPAVVCDAKWLCEHVTGITTTQKAGAIMRIAIAQGLVTKQYDGKGKPYYKAC